jgi:putative transposase
LKANRCRATDQGAQFTSYEWQEFLEQHHLTQSMSRRGNYWDRAIEAAIGSRPMANAVAESFFNLLKCERIRRRKYKTREEARHAVFDYIEFFYNPQRKHVRNGMLSPIDFEQRQKLKLQGF